MLVIFFFFYRAFRKIAGETPFNNLFPPRFTISFEKKISTWFYTYRSLKRNRAEARKWPEDHQRWSWRTLRRKISSTPISLTSHRPISAIFLFLDPDSPSLLSPIRSFFPSHILLLLLSFFPRNMRSHFFRCYSVVL